jgi:hypothetical protein
MLWMMMPLEEHYDDGFGAVGDAFRRAAETLGKNNSDGAMLWSHLPEIYLLRHAVELFLKSGIIIMHRKLRLPYDSEPYSSATPMMMASSGKWRSLFKTHDIPELYGYWKKLIVEHRQTLEAFGTRHLLETLQRLDCKGIMVSMPKRSTSVTLKMTADDYEKLKKAAAVLWPKALLTTSSMILSLALIAAEDVLKGKKK